MGRIIAITGKGGSGKTALAALMVKALLGKGKRLLAIDADSAISLPYALGVTIHRTVGDIRERIIKDPRAKKEIMNQHIKMVISEVVEQGKGFDLLAMGRGEGPGCFCAVNDLLKYGIDALSQDYHITIIDGEAGPEQVNRRVVQSVDTLVIVTDTSIRGFHTAELIGQIFRRDTAVQSCQIGLVINRFKPQNEELKMLAAKSGLELLGCIPEDETLARYDTLGYPLIDLPSTSPSLAAAQEVVTRLGLIDDL